MPRAVADREGQCDDKRLDRADVPGPHRLAERLLQLRVLAQIAECEHRNENIDENVRKRMLLVIGLLGRGHGRREKSSGNGVGK